MTTATDVRLLYFGRGNSRPPDAGSFMQDLDAALDQALQAGDKAGEDLLVDLWLTHLEARLGGMTAAALTDYLERVTPWRCDDKWPVFKTVDQPCLAFTCARTAEGADLLALAICYRYPGGSAETWWRVTVMPRLQAVISATGRY